MATLQIRIDDTVKKQVSPFPCSIRRSPISFKRPYMIAGFEGIFMALLTTQKMPLHQC